MRDRIYFSKKRELDAEYCNLNIANTLKKIVVKLKKICYTFPGAIVLQGALTSF